MPNSVDINVVKDADGTTGDAAHLSETWHPFVRKQDLRRFVGPKRIVGGIVFICLVGLAWYLRQRGYVEPELLFAFSRRDPYTASLVYVVLYALAFLLMIPTLPFNLGAGVLWGPFWGGMIAVLGSGLGAVGAFAIARTALGQVLVRRFDSRLLLWLQNQLETSGWRIIAFTRINPAFPSGPISFIFGLTGVRFSTYIWSSFVFFPPPAFAFATVGHEVGSFVLVGELADLVRMVLIVSVVITAMVLGGIFAKMMIGKRNPSNRDDFGTGF